VDKASGVAEIERKKHMPRTHKPYDADFRQQAVELLLSSGKTQREVARDLGICMETLRDWKQRQEQKPAKVSAGPGQGTALDLERENQRLRQELAYVQRQREILKKALAICSAQPELLNGSN
jgi:transposase-like protein